MAHERTLSIVKPDGVSRNLIGQVYSRLEKANLSIIAARMLHLSQREAEGFYAVHRGKAFFDSLTGFMSSGPVMVMVLEAPDAIVKWRTLMSATNPAQAELGSIRREFGESIERNATHGSDGADTAASEIGYFFAGVDLV